MAKKSNSGVRFLEGAAVGLALGVAGSIFMASKTGKKLEKDVEGKVADFFKSVAPKLKKMGKMGKAEYHHFMKEAATKYGKAKKMSAHATKDLMEKVHKSWDHLVKHS